MKSDPAAQEDFAEFNRGERGKTGRDLAPRLARETLTEMDTTLKEAGGTRHDEIVTEGQRQYPQQNYEFADGTLVRIKPQGDAGLNSTDPMYSVEMTTTAPPAGGNPQSRVAFKLDEAGTPVPKGSSDIKNPYSAKEPVQREAYQDELLRRGHHMVKK